MNIIDELSTSKGLNGGEANTLVAIKCVGNPDLLIELNKAINPKETKILGDICEVLTETAKIKPELISPFKETLLELIYHKNGRIQWESMHALALIAHLIPDVIDEKIVSIYAFIESSKGVIVRDYAVDTLANYCSVSSECSNKGFPFLKKSINLWDGKHAGKVMPGLEHVFRFHPDYKDQIIELITPFLNHKSKTILKKTKGFLRILNKS